VLRPQESAFRERKSLDGLWEFTLDPGGEFAGDLMAVPASYNDIVPGGREHVGVAWYRTSVVVPRGWGDRRVSLYFESATHRATVFVDGAEVARHEGGYTPFEVALPGAAAGATLAITVAVDNTLTFRSIPPGVVEDTPAGQRQRYFHDFFNYAGLHRTAWLVATDDAYISSFDVVAESDGTLSWTVDAPGEVGVILRDAAGAVVATGEGTAGTLRVEDVRVWAPGEGYLYALEARLLGAGGKVMDSYTRQVGFRTVTVEGSRFLINGSPFHFHGFARHEDVAVLGKGHSDAHLVHDFALMEWTGANSFRTSHYPYSEEVLEYADRRGFVVIDETAAVGLHFHLNQTTVSRQRYDTFGPDTINDATREVHAQAIRELVARDRNHPSVVMWSVANEPESSAPGADAYFAPLFALTRSLDPTRPVSFANCATDPYETCKVSRYADVLMLNRYYGWYENTGDLAAAELAWREELRAWAGAGKPILISEYGADTLPGLHAVDPEPWTEEYQAAYLAMNHRVFDREPAVVGEHVWNFADFATTSGITRVDGNRKGVFTRDRRPKAAAHLLRARWTAR
jgi:beta-glucuronidase